MHERSNLQPTKAKGNQFGICHDDLEIVWVIRVVREENITC